MIKEKIYRLRNFIKFLLKFCFKFSEIEIFLHTKGRAVSVGGVAFNNLIPPPLLTILRYGLACGVGGMFPIQWLNVAIWGNGWAWWFTVNVL